MRTSKGRPRDGLHVADDLVLRINVRVLLSQREDSQLSGLAAAEGRTRAAVLRSALSLYQFMSHPAVAQALREAQDELFDRVLPSKQITKRGRGAKVQDSCSA